jgi:hypothetical protein
MKVEVDHTQEISRNLRRKCRGGAPESFKVQDKEPEPGQNDAMLVYCSKGPSRSGMRKNGLTSAAALEIELELHTDLSVWYPLGCTAPDILFSRQKGTTEYPKKTNDTRALSTATP